MFVMAGDAAGRLWAIETSGKQAGCRPISAWSAQTNHFTSEEMLHLRRLPVSDNSLGRLSRAEEILQSVEGKSPDLISKAHTVLTDHVLCQEGERFVATPAPVSQTRFRWRPSPAPCTSPRSGESGPA